MTQRIVLYLFFNYRTKSISRYGLMTNGWDAFILNSSDCICTCKVLIGLEFHVLGLEFTQSQPQNILFCRANLPVIIFSKLCALLLLALTEIEDNSMKPFDNLSRLCPIRWSLACKNLVYILWTQSNFLGQGECIFYGKKKVLEDQSIIHATDLPNLTHSEWDSDSCPWNQAL